MIIRLDANKYPLQETAKRTPLQQSDTITLPADGVVYTLTLPVESNTMYFVKSWSITKGTDVDIQSITIDGDDTYRLTSVTDTESEYGSAINANSNIEVKALLPSSLTGSQDLTLQIDGYKIVF